ncbi:phosphodiester glycosidase family protein [Fervidobacterium thailandense]|uniref:phosphodiester glycosidase family protein n=1 Tax=Fervidobacterium thailandense TaxID=1008305 RepID=UPI000A68735A|nr:phosphodiester glycosidase family protein [Fervidobacterium thailandense]
MVRDRLPKILLIASFLLFVGTLFAQFIIFNGKVYEVTNGYLSEEQLRNMGFNILKNSKVYLVFNRKLIIGSNGDFIVDFESYVPKAYQLSNGTLYVRDTFLASFLGLKRLGNVYYDKPITVSALNLQQNELILQTDVELRKELVNVSLSGGKLKLSLAPAVFTGSTVPEKVRVTSDGATVQLSLENEYEDYEVSLDEKRFIILLVPKERRLEYVQKVEKFLGYNYTINYLIADPKLVDFVPLLPTGGIGKTAPLANILKANGVLHGVNANYFDPNTGLPIDIVIANGRVLSHRYGLRPVFVETWDDKVFIRKAYFDVTVRLGGVLLLVKGVNTPAVSEVNLYTEEYGLTIPRDASREYIVVRNGKVDSIGYVKNVPEGKNSYVVMVARNLFNKFLKTLKAGDSFTLEIYTDEGYRIKNAIGAGPLILQDGKIIEDSREEKMRYGGGIPTSRTTRTIVAIKDGKVHLITIEGGAGMNFDDVAKFLLEKGYQSAMMLDGGGSTSMVYQGRYVTSISPRNIPVALGLR